MGGILLALFSPLLIPSLFAQTFTPRYDTKTAHRSNGYYEYLPEGYSQGSQHYPLLIFFHGLGETGNGNAADLKKVLANGTPKQINQGQFPVSFTVKGQTFKFIVLVPQFWTWPDETDVKSIIDYAVKNYRVDEKRIYLTGLSMGGLPIWHYAGASAENSRRIAAIVPVCGTGTATEERCTNMAIANLPVWATHNEDDRTVYAFKTKAFVNGINDCATPPNPHAKMTIFPTGGHDAWSKTYNLSFKEDGMNVYEWMLQYTNERMGVLFVRDLKLSGRQLDGLASLSWTTAAEVNNAGFAIERSINGAQFDSIAFVRTQGKGAHYAYDDVYPVNGQNFYRLKSISIAGEISYSNVIKLDVRGNNTVSIFPNPVGDQLNLRTNYSPANAMLRIFDMTGKTIGTTAISSSGNHSIPLALPSGMYSAVLTEDGRVTFRQQFIKK